jgi:hypothetical protein
MVRGWIVVLCAVLLAVPAQAQTAPPPTAVQASEPLKARIGALAAMLGGEGDYDAYFSPGFRTAVPKDKFDQLTAQLIAAYGPLTGIEKVTPVSPWAATLEIGFRDAIGSAQISVDEAAPHRVSGLRITGVSARAASVGAVVEAIRALPGSTGFAVARLGAGAPQMLAAHAPDKALAVGSAFKLLILAELVRATNAGERKWTDMVTIDGTPLPGGAYTLSPKGTQLALKEVAGKMISISDNSATDLLLRLAGREKVEAMMVTTGVADPARNRPYLGTMELFKLKGVAGLADRWLAQDERGRRAMLDGEVAAVPGSAIVPTLFRDGKPVRIGEIEWFFTPADLVRVMEWLRRHAGAEAREVLAINPGLAPAVAAKWKFVGYKGGSEPGVLNLTWLLEGHDGSWTVITGSWNNPAAEVDLARFAGLLGRAAELSAPPTRP